MVDFSVFDSILDAVFVIDAEGKVLYCNDGAATLVQTSIRRIMGKTLLSDLIQVAEPGLLPFGENSPGRVTPTPFTETEITVTKAGKTGKAQLAVRPIDSAHWLFSLRDVSLEEALYAKFRSELAQKEDYARNLEKLVEARTAELNSVNQTLNAILNSLGQGFFTFGAEGDCGRVFTKACERVLEGSPLERKAWDVLRVPPAEQDQFRKWTESMFAEYLSFEDLKPLGPGFYPHSEGKRVVLDFYPIRREENAIKDIVVVATDKTAEYEAQIALEAERQYASMIVKFMKNRDQFLEYIASARESLAQLIRVASEPLDQAQVAEAFRILHTIEGEAGTFSLAELRYAARAAQHVLEPHKGGDGLPEAVRPAYLESLREMSARFEAFLLENQDIFRVTEGPARRRLEVPLENVHTFLNELQRVPNAQSIVHSYQDLFLRVPIEDRLKYFDALVQSTAEKLAKRVKPLKIEGGDVRIFPDFYKNVFSSLVHAFRNAVDHGLESPEEREWAGKDPAGQIAITIRSDAAGLHLTISDDGKGVDPSVIRAKLKTKYPEKNFDAMSDEDVIQEITRPGFSSRDAVGEFSGRGVGLDALREEVLKLGGELRVHSKVGSGTTLDIRLPELSFDQLPHLRSA